MPAWIWVTAFTAVAFVLFAAFGRGWWHSLWYSWRHAAHVIGVTEAEPVPAPEYGPVILAGERALYWPAPTRWEAAREDGRGWLEQTEAALSPEALDSDVQPDPYLDAIMAEYEPEFDPDDSGPGVLPSLPPGPDPERLRGPGQPHEKPAGTESAGPGLTRLADTADVLDARLLAEVTAMLRAQDDDAALYLSRLRSACAQYRLDLAAVLA